jgi:glycosyltransferase involved in cell wall biosynthesis
LNAGQAYWKVRAHMKICLVSAFPPSRGGLNEYGYHIAKELQHNPLHSLTVLADELESPHPELPEFDVVRCWSFDKLSNPMRLLRAVQDIKPDVVWFNLLFSTFGNNPVVAFAGLTVPALMRLSGYYTHVTLHHLMDNINLKDAGVRFPRMYRMAGNVATHVLLMANSVSVLLHEYRRTLIERYGGDEVHFRAHGILSASLDPPDFSQRDSPYHRILAFGKWGTYKRLELLLESFRKVHDRIPEARLVIAGANHPQTPGYVESVAERYRGNPFITFHGYVQEEQIPDLFRSASVMVMPYSSATGASGVAHLACEYGLPVICADILDFRRMGEDEQMAIRFYQTGDAKGLADCLCNLIGNPALLREMGAQNFSAAVGMTMPQIIGQYLHSFDIQQRQQALARLSRFRRIPAWVPARSSLFHVC